MTAGPRRRSFCRYCGALTTYLDGCCAAHRSLLPVEADEYAEVLLRDLITPPPGEAVQATREKGA